MENTAALHLGIEDKSMEI